MNELSVQLASALPETFEAGPQWLNAIRKKAASDFREYGLPTRKDEAWKYTGIGGLGQGQAMLSTGFYPSEPGASKPKALVEADVQIDMLDGQFLALTGDLPEGLTILPLNNALHSGVCGLQALLESLSDPGVNGNSSSGFSALNSATLDAGVVIHVAAETDAGKLAVTWSTRVSESPLLFNSRVCVILEEGASLNLVEQFESPHDNSNTSNIVFQSTLESAAVFHHIRFQQESDEAAVITRTEVEQQAGSHYSYCGFDLGGGLIRHDLHTSLSGPAARCAINGAYLLDGNRHVDNHARVDHRAPGGFSDQYFRGVAGGSSRAVFNTAVCVHPGADETEATQSNANILLSARAEIDTKPELEIYADEVIASHGATVGQLDELAVFYLRTRGLNEQDARQLLTTAFCRSVSDKVFDPVLGEVIAERMMDVMPQAE